MRKRTGFTGFVRSNDTYFWESRMACGDSSFFNVFTHEFIIGDPQKALTEPRSVVLTESTAEKYFGEENAYGQTLDLFDEAYKITGIIKDKPENVSFDFDLLTSIYQWDGYYNDPNWQNNNWMNFIVLKEGADPMELEGKFPALLRDKMSVPGLDVDKWLAEGNRWEYHLFSLNEVYMDLWGNGIYVLGFGIVAVFLLIIASINYMNLSKQTRQLMLILTVLILFVTALGLFGLATYATQERMKEIAIRFSPF